MTRPDWCPADIWEAAIKVHGNTEYDEVIALGGTIEALHAACDHDVADIARTVLAERQRCLNIAKAVPVAAQDRAIQTDRDRQWVQLMEHLAKGIEEGVTVI